MKKIIILAFVLLFAMTLIFAMSCGNKGNDTDTDNDKGSESIDTDSDALDSDDVSDGTSDSVDSDNTLNTDSDSSLESEDLTSSDGAGDLIPDVPTDEEVAAKVEALLESKHRLEYNEDGSFRVLVLADLHVDVSRTTASVNEVKANIKSLVDRVNPNLVIFTGDNTIGCSYEIKLRNSINVMVDYIEEKQIPWCHVYGNHDHEYALDHEAQQEIYESYEYCISKSVDGLSSVGNYVHAVYNSDGTIGSVIYLMNSGTYDSVKGGYAYIQDDQIAWYKETSELLQRYNDGELIKGMMAFHIPLSENHFANKNKYDKNIITSYEGAANEAIHCSYTDVNLFETAVERGDIKLIVTGHDHVNDYVFNYNGIKLSSSPNLSELTYTSIAVQGARVIDLNAQSLDNVITYVERLYENFDAKDFDSIGSNVDLEISEENIENPLKSGLNAGTLYGGFDTSLAEGRGPNGEDAIKIERDTKDAFEIYLELDNKGTLGSNKYLIVWMDLTYVDINKACFGIVTEKGLGNPYRTSDYDTKSSLYYLADGTDTWQTLYHGSDGYFGVGDSGSQSMKGLKGYFAIPTVNLRNGTSKLNSGSLVAYVYFCCSLVDGTDNLGKPIYISDFNLVESYKTFNVQEAE